MSVQMLSDEVCFDKGTNFAHALVRNRKLITSQHSHAFYEIILLFSGSVHHILNTNEHTLGAGDLVFINPGEVHLLRENSKEYELLSMQIRKVEMERFLDLYGLQDKLSVPSRPPFFTISASDTRSIFHLCRQILIDSIIETSTIYRIILGKMMHLYLSNQIQGDVPIWLRMAMDEMHTLRNASEGVQAFLRLSNLSHAQLCRLMKKHFGITPQQYVRDVRLNLAFQMVKGTCVDFYTISTEVGYNSYSHFCTAFKEKFGVSASQLRRSLLVQLAAEADAPGKEC